MRSTWLAALCVWTLQGAAVKSFDLPDTDGVRHTTGEFRQNKATVLVFIATDCPISNSYIPELSRIGNDSRDVAFFAVYSDRDKGIAELRKHRGEYRIGFPALVDPQATLARQTGVKYTPEVVVLGPDGTVLYRGRIDNRYYDYGKTRTMVTQRDLRDALAEIAAGKRVSTPLTKSLGCAIPGVN